MRYMAIHVHKINNNNCNTARTEVYVTLNKVTFKLAVADKVELKYKKITPICRKYAKGPGMRHYSHIQM